MSRNKAELERYFAKTAYEKAKRKADKEMIREIVREELIALLEELKQSPPKRARTDDAADIRDTREFLLYLTPDSGEAKAEANHKKPTQQC